MVDERYRYIVEAVFQPGRAVQQAAGTADEILRAFRRINTANIDINNLFGRTQFAQIENGIRQAIQRGVNVDLSNSPLLRQLQQRGGAGATAAAGIAGATPAATSRFLSENTRLFTAERNLAQALDRAALQYGTKGAFKNLDAAERAVATALGQVESASRARANAERRYASELNEGAARQRREQRDAGLASARSIRTQLDQLALQDADRRAAGFSPSFDNPDRAHATGRAQFAVNSSERALFAAEENLARVRQSQTRTAQQLIQAEGRVQAASGALAAAREREARLSAGPPPRGVAANFAAGFRGQSDLPYAQQIGQAFKFSVFYGTAYNLLFAFTQTLRATVQEGIEFQQAVTELKLATGQASEQANTLAESLGKRATEVGFAPSEGVLAGTRGVGLYGATDADSATQNRVAELAARTATRIAFNSGMSLEDVQTRLAAVTNAFQLGSEGQQRVGDLDAYFARRFQVAPGATIRTVAESGTVGQAAGFNLEQVNAIAALLQARTGQTDSAVAGFMAQIFSRGGEGSLTSAASKFGIDTTQELADQLRELSQAYKSASPNERTEIAAAGGRGKVQNAFLVLLQNFDEIEAEAAKAKAGAATGALDRTTDIRLDNLGGQLQVTLSTLKEFANVLGESGLLTVIGAGVVAFTELVEVATSLLSIWNEIPGPIRAVVASLLLLAAAQRSYAAGGVVAGLASRVGITGASGAHVTPAGATGGLAGTAAFAAATIGLVAVAKLKDSSDALAAAQRSASDALTANTLAVGASPDEIRGRVDSLKVTEQEVRDAADGFLSGIIGLGSEKKEALDLADRLAAEQKRLGDLAALQESAFAAGAIDPSKSLITAFDTETLAASMESITSTGGTARTRLDALSESLRGFGDAAGRAKASFDSQLFAGQQADPILKALQGSGQLLKDSPTGSDIAKHFVTGGLVGVGSNRDYQNVLPEEIIKQIGSTDIQNRLQQQLAGITSLADLSPEKMRTIAQAVVGDLPQQVGAANDLPESSITDLQDLMIGAVEGILREQANAVTSVVNGTVRYTQTELTNIVNTISQETANSLQSLPESDFAGRVQLLRRSIADIRKAAGATIGGITPGAVEQIALLSRQVAETQIARLENLRQVAQAGSDSEEEFKRIGRAFFRREVRAAIRGGNQDALAGLVAAAGQYGRRMALALINEAIKAQRAVVEAREAMFDGLDIPRLINAFPFGDAPDFSTNAPQANNKLKNLLKLKNSISQTPSALPGQDQFTDGYDDLVGQSEELQETAAQRRAALAQARAVRSESAIQQARADIQSARADMAAAEKGTTEYYGALSSFYSAQNALDDAIAAYQENRFLLAHDLTNPVDQAIASLRTAQARLRADRGKPADVQAANQVEVRRAQAELEAQKFQQRLQAVQTAEELGRISHRRYINYLENEHDRLNSIKNRTYQQQQQLDEIDGLLQTAADSMNAQWNFGDIDLPTPYQIRRRTEEIFGDPRDRLPNSTFEPARAEGGDTIINIDGADTGKVVQILNEILGRNTRTRTVRSSHR